MQHKQIVIIGGGPIGLVCALLLAKQGIAVTIIEASSSKENDGRVLALSYASIMLLKELNAWPNDLATPITQVHISHSGLGVSNILAHDVNLPYLGYTIKYSDICTRLKIEIDKYAGIDWQNGTVNEVISGGDFATVFYTTGLENMVVTTDLAILAEGGRIKIKDVVYTEHDYQQQAITVEIKTQKQHANIAYERFDDSGASVLLPHGDNFVLVKSIDKSIVDSYTYNLLENLQALPFMKRFGRIELKSKIFSFRLKLQVAGQKALDRVVLIGNSAQIVHPISAQGMNLALRDAMVLSELIVKSNLDQSRLKSFNQIRAADTKFVTGFTHSLVSFLEKEAPGMSHLRGLGIMALSNCKPVQNVIANSLIFGIS